MVLRYFGASMAAAVMIASLETSSATVSNVTFEWSCEKTAAGTQNLDLLEISTPILPDGAVATEDMKTREKVASVYIADTCFGMYQCDTGFVRPGVEMPDCKECCEKRWASFGNEFVEALDAAALSGRWAHNIAPCAFVSTNGEKPRPATKASELSWPQIKALSDLHRINEEIQKQADFDDVDDGVEEKIFENAAVLFTETFLRMKHKDLVRIEQMSQGSQEYMEERCQTFYKKEFPTIQLRPTPIRRDSSGVITEPFISPRLAGGGRSLLQSSLAVLREIGPSGEMDPGASSRQQEALSDDTATQ